MNRKISVVNLILQSIKILLGSDINTSGSYHATSHSTKKMREMVSVVGYFPEMEDFNFSRNEHFPELVL